LINLERVGDFGSRSDDVVLLGKCDDVVRDLCRELGWEAELDALWQATEASALFKQPTEQPEEEKEAKDEEGQTTTVSKEQSQAALEAVEARLAQLSIDEVHHPAKPDGTGASAPNATEVSSELPNKKDVDSTISSTQ
jgi:NAD-dependent histone deacetylase SIR2